MKELKDIFNDTFKNEIDGVMFAVFKMTDNNLNSELKVEKCDNKDFLFFLNGDNSGIYDILNADTQIYYDVDDLRFIANKFNYKVASILTDVYIFQKDKHDLEYFKRMADQLDEVTKLPIKCLIFRPIFDKFSKTLNDRLIFQVTNDNN